MSAAFSVASHFSGKEPAVKATYDALLSAARKCGAVTEDPKKTSIHLNRRTAFAGIATRKSALILTLKSDRDVASTRIHRRERASANRWHLEVRLAEPGDVDKEIAGWLKHAYSLSA